MGFFHGLLIFLIAFIAIVTSMLWISNLIADITNPHLDGTIRNARVWFGLVAAIFWALLIVLL